MYNISNITDANNIFEYYVAINQLSDQFLTAGIMITMFFILFISLRKVAEPLEALIATNFFLVIIGALFFVLGLIGWIILLAPILLFFFSLGGYLFMRE